MELLEKFIDKIKENDNSELMELYTLFKIDSDEIKAKMSAIKDEFAERMHKMKTNKLIIDVDGVNWQSSYQSTTRKKVDYSALLEIVGNHQYEEIVEENKSTFITIRKAPRKKRSKKTQQMPVEDNNLTPPVGNLA